MCSTAPSVRFVEVVIQDQFCEFQPRLKRVDFEEPPADVILSIGESNYVIEL